MEGKPESQICPARRHDRRASRLPTSYRASAREREMDDSILAMFPDDDHALGPFLGNLPPEILDVVVRKLGWFETTFAMAGRTCREAVERVASTRAMLTEKERTQFRSRQMTPLADAVVEGDVEALQWLIQLFDGKGLEWRSTYDGTELSGLAAKRGKLESLTYLRANGCPWDGKTCVRAAAGGHLGVLQWARQNGCPWDKHTCEWAAWGGHLGVLQWARRNGCPWNEYTCMYAARCGHLEVLQWARRNGCPWDQGTCADAAEGGHLALLQWARRNGCPWNEWTCNAAAKGGHLEVLQWARRNGCPWNEDTCHWAADKGHLEVLQWARQNGCPWNQSTLSGAHPRCRPYLRVHWYPCLLTVSVTVSGSGSVTVSGSGSVMVLGDALRLADDSHAREDATATARRRRRQGRRT